MCFSNKAQVITLKSMEKRALFSRVSRKETVFSLMAEVFVRNRRTGQEGSGIGINQRYVKSLDESFSKLREKSTQK